MPKIVVVALDICRKKPTYSSFASKTFDQQLDELEKKIKAVCEMLEKQKAPEEEWVFAWREFGLTNGTKRNAKGEEVEDRYLTVEQKARLKEVMSRLTLNERYPKITIISGTVATYRTYKPKDPRYMNKMSKLTGAVSYSDSLMLTPGPWHQNAQQIEKLRLQDEFFVVRNTSYLFSEGKCIAHHDKITPNEDKDNNNLEIENFEPADKVVYKPGKEEPKLGQSEDKPTSEVEVKGKIHNPLINEKIGVEICIEHEYEILKRLLKKSKQTPPLMHFILSDSTWIRESHLVSPYTIHIDSAMPTELVQNGKNNTEVSLYACDVLSDQPSLRLIDPQYRWPDGSIRNRPPQTSTVEIVGNLGISPKTMTQSVLDAPTKDPAKTEESSGKHDKKQEEEKVVLIDLPKEERIPITELPEKIQELKEEIGVYINAIKSGDEEQNGEVTEDAWQLINFLQGTSNFVSEYTTERQDRLNSFMKLFESYQYNYNTDPRAKGFVNRALFLAGVKIKENQVAKVEEPVVRNEGLNSYPF